MNVIRDLLEHAERGDSDYFQNVELGDIWKARDEYGISVLAVAAERSHLSCCQVIYQRCPKLLYERNKYGGTLLHEAASDGRNEIVEFLLTASEEQEQGSNRADNKILMMVDIFNFTALHYAMVGGHLISAKILIQADPSNKLLVMVSFNGLTAMHLAVRNRYLEIVKLLVEAAPDFGYPADIFGNNRFGKNMETTSGYMTAAEIGKLLVEKEPIQANEGRVLLHDAICTGDSDSVKDFIQFWPNCYEWVYEKGQNFFHLVVGFEQFHLVKYVLEQSYAADIVLNGKDINGNTPLHIAISSQNYNVALALLDSPRVNKMVANNEGKTAFDVVSSILLEKLIEEKYFIHCASKGDVDIFRAIPVDILQKSTDEDGESVLSTAAKEGHLNCCEIISNRCPELLYQTNKNGVGTLHRAAFNGKDDIVKFLLYTGGKMVNSKLLMMVSNNQNTALHLAVEGGHYRSAKVLIKADPNNNVLRMENLNKETAMHMAVKQHDLEIVKLLVDAHPAFVYSTNNVGSTPLLMALKEASTSDPETVKIRKLLIEKQAIQCIIPTGRNKWSLLHHATSTGDLSAIEDILQFAEDCLNWVDKEGQNFLHVAAKFDQVNVVTYILQLTTIPDNVLNRKDNYNNTPLHVAESCGNQAIAIALSDNPRVNKLAVNVEGRKASELGPSVLFQCAINGEMEFFRKVQLDVLRKSTDENGDSVLSAALRKGHLDCCQVILERCPALLHHKNKNNFTALHVAASNGEDKSVKFLLSAGSNFEQQSEQNTGSEGGQDEIKSELLMMRGNNNRTALHYAVDNGHLMSAKLLLDADATKDLLGIMDTNEETALHYAVKKHNFKLVELLVEADPNFEYSASNPPFSIAVQEAITGDYSKVKIRNLLIQKQPGQCKVKTGENGWTQLHHATFRNDLPAITEIANYCRECLEEVDNDKRNILHLATSRGLVSAVKHIVDLPGLSGSVLNGKDTNEQTPLHIAISRGTPDMVLSLLYDERVDKNIKNKQGISALKAINFYYDKRRAGVIGRTDLWDENDFKEQSNFDLLVGALIATVSFTAGITVPGGFISSGPNEGNAILYKKRSFEAFVVSNTIALALSLFAVFSHFCMRRLADRITIHHLNMAANCSIGALFAMMVAFIAGSYAVLSISNGLALTVCVICGCFFISAFVSVFTMRWKRHPKTPVVNEGSQV